MKTKSVVLILFRVNILINIEVIKSIHMKTKIITILMIFIIKMKRILYLPKSVLI